MGLELGTPKMPKRNDEETHDFWGLDLFNALLLNFSEQLSHFLHLSSFLLFHQNSWKSMLKIGRCVFFLPLRHPIFAFTTGKHHKAKAIREQTRHGLMEQKWLSREQGGGSWERSVEAVLCRRCFNHILVWFPDRCACS